MGIEERLRRRAEQQERSEKEAAEKAEPKAENLNPSQREVAEAVAGSISEEVYRKKMEVQRAGEAPCTDQKCEALWQDTVTDVLEQLATKYDENLEGYRRAQERLVAERDELLETLQKVTVEARRLGLMKKGRTN